jgi:hypothetical protein
MSLIVGYDDRDLFGCHVARIIGDGHPDSILPPVFIVPLPRRFQLDCTFPISIDDLIGEYILNGRFTLVVSSAATYQKAYQVPKHLIGLPFACALINTASDMRKGN